MFGSLKREFQLNRQFITGYYVAILISQHVFGLTKDFIAKDLTPWIDNLLKVTIGYDAGVKGTSWFLFTFVCFLVVWGVKKVVELLEMTSDSNESIRNEVILGVILLLGFFFYTINTTFVEFFEPVIGRLALLKTMPEWIPDFVRRALSDPGTPIAPGNRFWGVFPFVWTLGPLFLMVYMEFQKRFHFEVKKEG
jgi:hypothetical protein